MADMAVGPVVSATGGQVNNPAVAVTSINNADGGSGTDSYRQYNGDGTTGAGWPDKSAWESFDNMYMHIQRPEAGKLIKRQVQQQQTRDVEFLQSVRCSSRLGL